MSNCMLACRSTAVVVLTLAAVNSSSYAMSSPEADGHAIRGLAGEFGLTAPSLVVAEVAGAQTTAVAVILGRLADAENLRTAFDAQQQTVTQSGATVTALEKQLSTNSSDGALVQQYNMALSALASAEDQLAILRADLLDLALNELPSGQVNALAIWRSSLAFDVRASFRVAERSEEEWLAIIAALRAEQSAIRAGESLAGPPAALLASVRSEPAVIAAENRLTLYLSAAEQAFEQFDPGTE